MEAIAERGEFWSPAAYVAEVEAAAVAALAGEDVVAVSQFAEAIGAAKAKTGRKWVEAHFVEQVKTLPGRQNFPAVPKQPVQQAGGKGKEGQGKGKQGKGKGKGPKAPWEWIVRRGGSQSAAVPLALLKDAYCQ